MLFSAPADANNPSLSLLQKPTWLFKKKKECETIVKLP